MFAGMFFSVCSASFVLDTNHQTAEIAEPLSAPAASLILSELSETWRSHRSTVATARIVYQETLIRCRYENAVPLTAAEAEARLDLTDGDSLMTEFVRSFRPDLLRMVVHAPPNKKAAQHLSVPHLRPYITFPPCKTPHPALFPRLACCLFWPAFIQSRNKKTYDGMDLVLPTSVVSH